jgi:hypothetical protein
MLNLYEILQKILTESVDAKNVMDAITNHNYVDVSYSDEENNAPGHRLIQPYAYGISKSNNGLLRAFQIEGDTLRGEPKWKTFRIDRITSWKPRKQTFNVPPPMQGYNVPEYNENGDRTMSKVILQAKFDNIKDSLGAEKAKTEFVKGAPKIATKNTSGPIPNASQQWKRNVFTSQPNSQKYAQYAKNIKDTENELNRFDDNVWAKAEAEKNKQDNSIMQNTAMKPKQMQQGPVTQNINKDDIKNLK